MYFHYSDKDNLPLDVKFGTDSKYIVENNYDELTRLKFKTYTIPSTGSKINTSYSYVDWSSTENRTTGTVRGIDYTYVAGGLSTHDRWYTYDNAGNILSECVWTTDATKPVKESYTYDSKNQLVRHDSATLKATYTYAYDAGGNITTKKTYAYTTDSLDGKTPTETINYTYGNSAWGDELTSYKGEAIEYDEIGNPELYRGWAMGWEGRQLKSAGKNGTNLSFTYDSEGIRTSKTVGSTTTKYLLNGTQILAQTTNGKTLCFFYDQQGNRVGMADGKNNFYYYIYNVQGDVIALADASTGKLVATYTYDAWGKLVEFKDTTANSVGTQNPFRYRGYYYDTDCGLYYLNSRYYDAETGRFINADKFASTDPSGVLSANMFAYCENNPIIGCDPTGEFFDTIFDAISLCSSVVKALKNPSDTSAWIEVGLNAACFILPGVTGLGIAYKAAKSAKQVSGAVKIKKAKDFTKEARSVVKSLDRSTGYTKSSLSAGREIHKGYKVGVEGVKEYRGIKGMRPDFVDFKNATIYELKPNNPRSINQGINQLQKYNKALGGEFNMVLELY